MADELERVVSSDDVGRLKAHETAEVDAFWTEDAMRAARPVEMRLAEPPLEMLHRDVWTQAGPQTVFESRPPDGEEIEPFVEEPAPAAGYATSRVADLSAFPYCTIGKMFMVFDGSNFVGSAWVIAEQAVFTAGHCVYDKDSDGGWADNVLFVPQYDNGSAPVGRWTATKIWSLEGWSRSHDFRYDMAVFQVDRPIRPKTGSLGWMANFPPNQGPYRAIGYPASPVPGYNFNGEHMWQSLGGYINGTNPIQMHNNMTPGCSGGPWTVTRNSTVYANGLNSFRYATNPNTMYSPYFGDGFIELYNAAK